MNIPVIGELWIENGKFAGLKLSVVEEAHHEIVHRMIHAPESRLPYCEFAPVMIAMEGSGGGIEEFIVMPGNDKVRCIDENT